MQRLRSKVPTHSKESIHRREGTDDDRSRSTRMRVDPMALLRMIVAKQARSEKLFKTAHLLGRVTRHRQEHTLIYESMQENMMQQMERLYTTLNVPFDAVAHQRVPPGSSPLLKHAPEDLSQVISNWQELLQAFAPYPCLQEMLRDTSRRIFDDCSSGNAGRSPDVGTDPSMPCSCSWRTPIVDQDGNVLNDALVAAMMAKQHNYTSPVSETRITIGSRFASALGLAARGAHNKINVLWLGDSRPGSSTLILVINTSQVATVFAVVLILIMRSRSTLFW